jgi:hypothetical protein
MFPFSSCKSIFAADSLYYTHFKRSAPALFEKYQSTTPQAVDEWTLSEAMAADTASGGLQQLETHYQTFIVSFSMLHK